MWRLFLWGYEACTRPHLEYKKLPSFYRYTMPSKTLARIHALSPGDVSAVIQMAWEDRTAFETIQERVGVSEAEVIEIMRRELKPSSFKMWRTRMSGRKTKHRALRRQEMKFDDRAIADHRRPNA